MKNDHPIRLLCLYLKASPSGFYDWEQRQVRPGVRALENQALAQEIGQIHARSRQTYGAPRIAREAIRVLQGLHRNHNKQYGLRWEDVTAYIYNHALGRKLTKAEINRFVQKNILTIQR